MLMLISCLPAEINIATEMSVIMCSFTKPKSLLLCKYNLGILELYYINGFFSKPRKKVLDKP